MNWWDDPVFYMLILTTVAVWFRRKYLIVFIVAMFAVISLTPFSILLIRTLEGSPAEVLGDVANLAVGKAGSVIAPSGRQAIVVLTGGTVHYYPAKDRYEWSWAADRVTEALRLYKKGGAPLLVFSGTEKTPERSEREIDSMARLAREWGVPSEALILEDRARNTAENAELTARILKEKGISDFYLVTSAFHMLRARRCFEKQGLSPVVYPVDFSEIPEGWKQWLITPGRKWFFLGVFLHETIGMAVYWIKGAI